MSVKGQLEFLLSNVDDGKKIEFLEELKKAAGFEDRPGNTIVTEPFMSVPRFGQSIQHPL